MDLDHASLAALEAMGPSARHQGAAATLERVSRLPEPFRVTASVAVTVLRRRP